jgi:hypothetical protein
MEEISRRMDPGKGKTVEKEDPGKDVDVAMRVVEGSDLPHCCSCLTSDLTLVLNSVLTLTPLS